MPEAREQDQFRYMSILLRSSQLRKTHVWVPALPWWEACRPLNWSCVRVVRL